MDERDERKRTADDASKPRDGIKTRGLLCPGKSMVDTYLLTMRCPVYRQRESHSGFCTELENLVGDGNGKGTSGENREAESTDAPTRGGLPRSNDEVPVMGME